MVTKRINTFLMGFLILNLIQHQLWCREYEECENIDQPDAVVASRRSCAKYIFCDGDNSYEGECLAGNYFNENAGTCDDPENVDCDIEEHENVISIYAEDFNKSEIERQELDTGTKNELIPETTIDLEDIDDLNIIPLPTLTSEVEENNNNGVTISKITPKCPELYGSENIKHIPNADSCVAFYTCYNGIAIPMLCPSKMYFNEVSEKCQKKIPLKCKFKYSITLKCEKGIYDYMPHPKRCEYYQYCLNGFLMIMRCPYDFTWHYERRSCVHKSQSKCYVEHFVNKRYPS